MQSPTIYNPLFSGAKNFNLLHVYKRKGFIKKSFWIGDILFLRMDKFH